MNKRNEIYLGALLHDIGKFYQRASGNFESNTDNLSPQVKKIADNICPVNQKGYFGYLHVLWTYQFFLDHKEIFNKVIPQENIFDKSNNNQLDNYINYSIYHHKPYSLNQAIIQLADWWASGIDRSKCEEYTNSDINWGKNKYKKVPLSAIFQNVFVNWERPQRNKEYYFDLNPLSLDRNIICPKKYDSIPDETLESSYKKLWQGFVNEFKSLPTANFKVFVESLHFLLKKYTWCIPASTKDYPDSSLFEHSKLVAAFADSFYSFFQEEPNAFEYKSYKYRIKLNKGYYPTLLLCADISGIQNFIYNISSKRAAKSLRGRSFYLQILMETIANELIEKTNTFTGNVVYSSGGKMFCILPNTRKVREIIEDYRKETEKWIWDEFNGSIYVSIEYVPFAYDMDHGNKEGMNILIEGKDGYFYLGDLWKTLVDKTAKWKTQKFKSLILNDESIFDPFGRGGEVEVCSITGIESENLRKIGGEGNEEEIKVLPRVKEQIDIGEKLVDHKYLIYTTKNQPNHVEKLSKFNFNILKSQWYIFDEDGLFKLSSIDNAIVYKENDFNFLSNKKGENSIYRFRFYGGNEAPTTNKRLKTLEELVDQSGSFKRLAVLRMDVDSLSQLFINGFKEKDDQGKIIKDRSNFSKISTLSFQLDLFFSGYLNQIHSKYLDNIIIVYSGGDDLFAVGDWKKIIEFAEDIRDEFRNFVCERDDLGLSGGIVLVKEKFPIAKAADLAGDAENKAKKFGEKREFNTNTCRFETVENPKKNAINFLGESISWNSEFLGVKWLKEYLYNALVNQQISKGLLQKIFYFRTLKNSNIPSWHWLSAYTFTRHKNEKNIEVIEKLKRLFVTNAIDNLNGKEFKFGERAIDLLSVAARWAELELRNKK